jgi:N-acyl amino acid synthase of PEP-CTERM/exosortase system
MTRFLFRKIAKEDPLLQDVFRLRYKVYCEEWGFENPADHPGGLETDEFDQYSVHLGAFCRERGNLIGTIRLILNSPLGFPIEQHCTLTSDLSNIGRHKIAEISRLAVSKEFRKRAIDNLIYNDGQDGTTNKEAAKEIQEKRKQEFFIIMGLYTCMYRESEALGLTHWYALMAKGLQILLKRMNILFAPIGPEVDYHGQRIPYLGAIDKIVREVSHEQSEYFQEYERAIVSK